MALDFTLSAASDLVGSGKSVQITVTLTGGALSLNTTFTASGSGVSPGAASMAALSPTGSTAVLTWTPTKSGIVTVTATGGLTTNHTIFIGVATPSMVTAFDIIQEAQGLLKIRDPAQAGDPIEAANFLSRLNMLIDGWRLGAGFAYSSQNVTGKVLASKSTVTIGPSGDIVLPYRPTELLDGCFTTRNLNDYPLQVITDADYQQIGYKGLTGIGPDSVYYSPDLPNGTLYFFPITSGSNTAFSLNVAMEVDQFQDLSTFYTLPPGYKRALAYSMAEEMAPDYGKEVPATVSKNAMMARRSVRQSNFSAPSLASPFQWRSQLFGGSYGANLGSSAQTATSPGVLSYNGLTITYNGLVVTYQ